MVGEQEGWHWRSCRPVVAQDSEERPLFGYEFLDHGQFIDVVVRDPLFTNEHQTHFFEHWRAFRGDTEGSGQNHVAGLLAGPHAHFLAKVPQ